VPFDDLIQYNDEDSSGIVRQKYLKELDAWLGIDNRIDRAPTYVKACPHLFVMAKPTDEDKDDAKGGKKAAKKDAKKVRGYAHCGICGRGGHFSDALDLQFCGHSADRYIIEHY